MSKNAGSNKINLTIPVNPQKLRGGWGKTKKQSNFVSLGLRLCYKWREWEVIVVDKCCRSQICSHCLQPKVKIWKNRNVIADNLRPGPLWLTRSWSRPILDKIGADGWAASARGLPNMSLPEMNLQIETKLRKIETEPERLCQKSHLSWEQSPVAV